MDPMDNAERAAWITRTTTALAGRLVDQVAAQLVAGDSSTDSLSFEERALLRILRPMVPKLRGRVLSKLSELSPAAMEQAAGALATGIEEMLAAAPGRPLVRYRAGWDASGAMVVLPMTRPLGPGEACPVCPHPNERHDELLGCLEQLDDGASCPCRVPGCGCGH